MIVDLDAGIGPGDTAQGTEAPDAFDKKSPVAENRAGLGAGNAAGRTQFNPCQEDLEQEKQQPLDPLFIDKLPASPHQGRTKRRYIAHSRLL
jgi:hypothetical protein